MSLRNNLVAVSLLTLLLASITDGISSSEQKQPSSLPKDKPRPYVPTGKCQTAFQKSPSDETHPDNPETHVECFGLSNLTFTLNHIPPHIVSSVKSIHVFNSSVPILNLGLFSRFPRLQQISVIHSSVSLIRGSVPPGITSFNLSSNHIKHIESSIFGSTRRRRSGGSLVNSETNESVSAVAVISGGGGVTHSALSESEGRRRDDDEEVGSGNNLQEAQSESEETNSQLRTITSLLLPTFSTERLIDYGQEFLQIQIDLFVL